MIICRSLTLKQLFIACICDIIGIQPILSYHRYISLKTTKIVAYVNGCDFLPPTCDFKPRAGANSHTWTGPLESLIVIKFLVNFAYRTHFCHERTFDKVADSLLCLKCSIDSKNHEEIDFCDL